MILSVVIPSYQDPYLHKTIDSLLSASELGDQMEVIVVLDGYTPEQPVVSDSRVRVLSHDVNRGMRDSINTGVYAAKGKYLMRTDEHCKFGQGYDRILVEGMQDNWIMTPRRYFLNPEKWEIMDLPPVDYMSLHIAKWSRGLKFSGIPWNRPDREGVAIDETFAMQGSCWIMAADWWHKVIVKLQNEGYDTHYQDSHEMSFKTWQAGGKLMVNKNTWYAHKHRLFPRSHKYGGEIMDKCFAYAIEMWEPYFRKEISPRQKALGK